MKAPQLAIMLGIAVISIAAAGLACETKAQKQPGLQRDLPALFQELEKYGLLPEMTSRQELEILQKLAATLKVPMFFEQQCQEQEKSEDQEDDKIPAAPMLEPFLEHHILNLSHCILCTHETKSIPKTKGMELE